MESKAEELDVALTQIQGLLAHLDTSPDLAQVFSLYAICLLSVYLFDLSVMCVSMDGSSSIFVVSRSHPVFL